ncbi:MAG: hypothetical protein NT034_04365 [Candidatus Magasanikbacteria bacterium]|nr:hypothetical protein [Candidatus Magasanikbacteria bacterium]
MKNKNIFLSAAMAVLLLNVFLVPNAHAAVKLEVPKSVVDLWQKIKSQQQVQADDNGGTMSAPPGPAPSAPNNQGLNNPPQGQNFDKPFNPAEGQFNNQMPMKADSNNQQFNQNQQPQDRPFVQNGQNQMPPMPNDQQNLRTFKNGAKQMNGMLNNFQKQMQGVQKNGDLPPQMQDKMQEAKGLINKIQDAKSTTDLGNNTVDQLQGVMTDLQQTGEQTVANTQRLSGVKKEMGNMEKNIASFQKQLDKLSKQGISAPSDVTTNIAQIKTILDAVKGAQSMEDVQNSGMEDMGDLMNNLNESRQQLEMLSRWPQTGKQIDKQLKNFDRFLSKDKNLVDKLAKQGVDISDTYQKLSDGLTQLKSARDQATDKIKSGDAESAYDLLQNDFFDKVDDLSQQQSIFDTLSNLGRFNSDFKRETTNAKRIIAKLNKQGEDVSDLNKQLAEINQKGTDLASALKAKPIDIESISNQLEDLSGLRQDFQNTIQELSPDNSPKPWEQGQDQFQNLKLSPSLNTLIAPGATSQQ